MVVATRSHTGTPIKKPSSYYAVESVQKQQKQQQQPSPLGINLKEKHPLSAVATAAATKLDKEVVHEFGGPLGVSIMMVSDFSRFFEAIGDIGCWGLGPGSGEAGGETRVSLKHPFSHTLFPLLSLYLSLFRYFFPF
jgi:hypothetical protein